MKKIVFSILLSLTIPFIAMAQGNDALPFTVINHNPGSVGDAAYSAFSNAAELAFSEKTLDAAASYQYWAPSASGTSYVNAAVAYKFSSSFGMSLGFSEGLLRPYDILGNDGLVKDSFRPTQTLVSLGAAFGLGKKLSLGVNARFAMEKISEDDSFNGLSADISLGYSVLENLRFYAGLSTLGTKIVAANKKEFGQPAYIHLSGLWNKNIQESRIDVTAAAAVFLAGGFTLYPEVAYTWKDFVTARLGYRIADDKCLVPSHLTIGAGVKYANCRLDISYLTASEVLGNTISVGLGYSF